MRICLVFDCLYPTPSAEATLVPGLAERLAARDEVTYLTLLQWDPDAGRRSGVEVVAVAGRAGALRGRTAEIGAQLRSGSASSGHLLRHGRRYDVVQRPPFIWRCSVLAARPFRAAPLLVDWFEVWTREYWREYLGGSQGRSAGGSSGLARASTAFWFSRLHEQRLERWATRARSEVDGRLQAGQEATNRRARRATVVFAGRQSPRRGVRIVPAVAIARKTVPELRAGSSATGPSGRCCEADRRAARGGRFAPGFVPSELVEDESGARSASSSVAARGYGLVVVEAAVRRDAGVVVDAPTTPRSSSSRTV